MQISNNIDYIDFFYNHQECLPKIKGLKIEHSHFGEGIISSAYSNNQASYIEVVFESRPLEKKLFQLCILNSERIKIINTEEIFNPLFDELAFTIKKNKILTTIHSLIEKLDLLAVKKIIFENNKILTEDEYLKIQELVKNKESKAFLKELIKENRLEEADIFFKKTMSVDKEEYNKIKKKVYCNLISERIAVKLNENQLLAIADSLLLNNLKIPDKLSLNDTIHFFIKHLKIDLFTDCVESYILGLVAKLDEDNFLRLELDQIVAIISKHLLRDRSCIDAAAVWTIIGGRKEYLSIITESSKDLLNKIVDYFPWDKLNTISSYYFPSEDYILSQIPKLREDRNIIILNELIRLCKQHEYYNCMLIFSIIQAVDSKKNPLKQKDILDLIKIIIEKLYNYKADNKNKLINLLFPKCISEKGFNSFSIRDRDYSFCEGILTDKIDSENNNIVMCRNKKCIERTKNFSQNYYVGTYFFDIIFRELGMLQKDFFKSKEFARSMCAYNRWNEIVEHLFCGYREPDGCDSVLIFQNINQVSAGFAAYATTFWHCTNAECKKHIQPIKISHCRKCKKIIDSRIDTHRCPREDHAFYICVECGYCCEIHKVSGICPKCGVNAAWDRHDQYNSKYRCRNCQHIIKVPLSMKGCLSDSESFKNSQNDQKNFYDRSVIINEDDYDFDKDSDIPF